MAPGEKHRCRGFGGCKKAAGRGGRKSGHRVSSLQWRLAWLGRQGFHGRIWKKIEPLDAKQRAT